MNRLLYRIVFNKARGMLMVVAEIARACSGASPSSGIGHTHSRRVSRVSAISFSLWLASGVIQPVQAAIIADKSAPGNQHPTVIGTANGTPQVNIQTPSAGGVSRNTYSQFDVDQKGVILNNARKNTSTQLGGMVSANPWLAKGEAKIILNEVNGRNPSRLNGYIEVAGQKAQVVIANPAGIGCSGCGFINAGRITLTTGTPQMQNGNLTGYQVERGEITVDGKGLDASRQGHTDIIARAVRVNAAVHANDLKVTTGRNRVDAAHEQTTVLADNGSTRPQLALDVAQVGGMYAGKIRLRGTEKGVGVRNAGHIGTEAGLVTITADGRIENSGEVSSRDALHVSANGDVISSGSMLSQKSLSVSASGNITNSGSVWSSDSTTVSAASGVHNSGTMAARNHVTLSGSRITSTGSGTLAAGVQSDGKTGTSGDLKLTASGKLDTHGLNVAGGDIHMSAQGLDASASRMQATNITLDAKQQSLSTAGAQVIAGRALKATTTGTLNNNAGLLAADKLSLTAKRLQNNEGRIVQSGTDALVLNHQDGIENHKGSIATNARDLTLNTRTLDNRSGEIIHAGSGALTVSSATFLGDNGTLSSSGTLALKGQNLVLDGSTTTADGIRIDADTLSNRDGQLLQSGHGTMVLAVRQNTDNRGGVIAANGSVQLGTRGLDNRKGQVLAAGAGSLTVKAQAQADSREGLMAAAGNVTVTTGQLHNDGGLISSETGGVTIASDGALTNMTGQIAAKRDVQVTADGLDSRQGLLVGDNVTLALGSAAFSNQNGAIAAQNNLSVSSGELNNDAGLLRAGRDLTVDTHGQALTNRNSGESGGIYAQSALTLRSGMLDNARGVLITGGETRLTTASVNNQDGVLAAGALLNLSAQGTVNNDRGLIQSTGRMDIDTHANWFSNRENLQSGGLVAGDRLTLNAGDVDNSRGLILSDSDVSLHASALLSREGALVSAGDMTLSASGLLDNTAGLLQAARSMTVDTHGYQLINKDTLSTGGILAGEALSLATGEFDNESGAVVSDRAIQIKSGRLNNLSGVIVAQDALSARVSGPLINDAGLIQSGADMRLDTQGNSLSNRQTEDSGGIFSAAVLQINSGALDNREGSLVAAGAALLTTGAVDNQDGLMAAGQTLDLLAQGAINSDRGLIQSGSDMHINTHGNTLSNRDTQTTGGGIISFGTLDVTSGTLNNQNGLLAGAGNTTLQATTVDNRSGVLASENALSLSGQSVDNRGGTLSAAREMALTLADTLDNREGVVSSGENLTIAATRLDNVQGVLVTGGDAALDISQTGNRQGQIAAQGNMTLTGQRLDNDNGGLVQSGADMTLTVGDISNRNSGDTGGITSQGNMHITSATLLNDRGLLLAGKQAVLDTGRFSNISGTLVALEQLRLSTGSDTDNRDGLIQGSGVILDTRDHLLDNRGGTIYSLASMQLATAGLDNRNGTLGAKGDFTLRAGWLDNSNGGRVVGEHATALTVNRLVNRNGQIQSVGSLLVSAAQGVIDNTLGLIRSGATVTLNAASLINRDTQAADKGIEGLNVVAGTQTLDNTNGTLLAGQSLGITNAGTLTNIRGELAAGGTLSLEGSALNLVNTAGVVKAGERVTIQADRIGGDGQLLSLGDMVLNSRQDMVNTGEMIANGNLTLTTPGRVTNSGKLLAGAKLDLTSGNLYNAGTGEIAAGHTWLTVADTLTNYGLIDGNRTLLKAGTLTNTGTGRIYGDYVGIQAGALNNLAENGTAATIAGRERVDIGAGTVNNRDHALIYSGGDMVLGGQLDAGGMATGQADVLSNHSSTIESAGNMALSVGQLNNINDRFTTEVVQVSTEHIHEYQHNGSPNRWDANADGVFVDNNSADSLLNLNTPEDTGHNNDNFYEYDYTRTIEEEVIQESDPGKILSGGHLSINAGHVLNDKSQIVAGGTLGIVADTVDNVMPEGQRWITDEGSVTHYSRKSNKGGDSQRTQVSDYVPPTVIQSITLRPGRLEGNSSVNGSGLQLAAAGQHAADTTIRGNGGISAGVDSSTLTPGMQSVSAGSRPDLSGGMPGLVAGAPALSGRDIPARQPVVLTPGQQFEIPVNSGVSGDSGPSLVVRVTGPDTRLPDNSLFRTHPEPGAAYLVETDPRFTNNKQWLGSDYMQNAFAMNHDNMHKRLGDGYYEQCLVREQIVALTGGRYLGDHRSDEAQFKALMDAGISFGKQHNLIPGVALTAEQMSLLTGDMVWLVNTQVQLADGSWQTVMVPQVYVRVKPGDIDGSGALLGGQNVVMQLKGDLLNSGTLSGREAVQLSAENITNKAGTIQGADVSLQARTDINNIGGIISGNNTVLASAGRDINVVTTTRSAQSTAGNNRFERTTLARTGGIYVQGEDGKLSLSAGRDISLSGAQVVNSGKNSQTVLNAGRDLNLKTITTSASDSITWDKNNWLKQSATQHTGSEISGAGSVVMVAGRDVNAQAATVSAGGSLGIGAGRDISITAATDSSEFESKHKYTGSSGAFSKKTTTTHDVVNRETAQGSLFSGDSVNMRAGNNLLVQGSGIVGDNDVRLKAGNNLTITTAEERSSESHQKQEKKSGLSGTGGIGMTYGSQALKVTDTAQNVTHQGSTVGSVNGNVTLAAGNDLAIHGSDIIAGNDMTLAGKNVSVTSATENSKQTHEVEQKSSGFTLALSGAAGSALNGAVQSANQAKESDNDRLAALQGVKAALSGVQASQAVRMDEARGDSAENNNTVGVSLSYGSQSSKSTQTSEQTTSKGSSLTAGNNMTVIASGSGQKGQDGDILIQGSQVQAGNDVLLSANRDVNLISAENTSKLDGKNESKGGSVGVGIGAGSGGWGISVSASVNAGKGSEKGNGTTHTETTVDAGNNLTITSGRDANLIGAQVSGESVTADIGRDLTLRSEQDSDSYHSKQQNVSASGTFNIGSMSGSASVNASRDKMDSNYQSVNEQSGITAGSGGFDIKVGGHTQLDGAVIASSASEDKNRLDTGTLGWSDIHNEAEYKTEHQSVGMSSGGSIGGQFAGNMANSLLTGVNSSGSAEGTTSSAISGGNIIIRDKDSQQQNVDDLSRDTANANGSIGQIFDKEKEQQKIDQAQLIGEISNQATDIARTEGDIAATKAAQEKMKNVTGADRAAALTALEKQGKTEITETDIQNQIYQTAYNEAMNASGLGTGGKYQQMIQAASAAAQGLAGGDMNAAIAGAAAPYVAEAIGHHSGLGDDDKAAKIAAHAVANAVLASMQGQNALAGAAGAATGEVMGMIAQEMYGKPVSELSETEKQTISALATIASGIAGGIAGDSTSSALAGAQSGKTTVENNNFNPGSFGKGMADYVNAVSSWNQHAEDKGLTLEQKQAGLDNIARGDLPEGANITKVIVEGYQDGVMIAGAWYLGPAASVGKVIAGGAIAEIVNGTYQWLDINSAENLSLPESQRKTWDYRSSTSAGISGMLSPGRGVWQNVGIAAGGAFFTDGPDAGSMGSAAAGAWLGGKFAEHAPGFVNSVTGKELPGFIYEIGGAYISEQIGDIGKEIVKDKEGDK
ncbi:hemagglutinin repeat-containing protein [Enterobacter ludwigii]|nr:hemagglutinin repeat-containing protein [Enterobacter ludwigii]